MTAWWTQMIVVLLICQDLVHSRCCSYSVSCGNQAAQYRPLSLENGCHISQVEITFNSRSQLDGKTVGCLDKVDNNGSANVLIGRTVITPTKVLTAPPSIISVNDDEYRQLTFSWDGYACDKINHKIQAMNCGDCPATTTSTSVTCTDVPRDGTLCRFAVQRVMCGDIVGNLSRPVVVNLKGAVSNTPQVVSFLAVCLACVMVIFVIYTIITSILFKAKRKASHQRGRVNNAPRQENEEAMYEDVSQTPTDTQIKKNIAYKPKDDLK